MIASIAAKVFVLAIGRPILLAALQQSASRKAAAAAAAAAAKPPKKTSVTDARGKKRSA